MNVRLRFRDVCCGSVLLRKSARWVSSEVMGVLPLNQLPDTREEYDTQLRAKGFTQ
jgi:hypothetical protein